MSLLERDVALGELDAELSDTTQGLGGRIALVSGEAGIGKTALVEHFARRCSQTHRVLSGACDPLSMPRPLGPLHDMAEQVDGELSALLVAGAERGAVFSAALAELAAPADRCHLRGRALGRRSHAGPAAVPGPTRCAHHRIADPDLSRRRARQQSPGAQAAGRSHVADEVLRAPAISTNARMTALAARGRLHARQGVHTVPAALDEALDLALALDVFNAVAPIRAARAEAAWLAGDAERALAETESVYATAVQKKHAWLVGELALWRWRAGVVESLPDWVAEPFAQQIGCNWRAAADAWRRLGCPYEEASALGDGDVAAQEQALAIFDRLGARPAAAELRRAMRARGIVRQPRGPRQSTRANHFGLTPRQLEILSLLAEGLSNAEIAARLSITPKTAEHHVAAVLAKLDVPSRQAAVRKYRSASSGM